MTHIEALYYPYNPYDWLHHDLFTPLSPHSDDCADSTFLNPTIFVVLPKSLMCVSFLFIKMLTKLGVMPDWHFVDVLDLEDGAISTIPTPCCALMLLFPLTQQVDLVQSDQPQEPNDFPI